MTKSQRLKSDKLYHSFVRELAKFRQKFPMCYIEAWNPYDFEDQDEVCDNMTDWYDPKHLATVDVLYDNFDANYGTNWDRIKDCKQ